MNKKSLVVFFIFAALSARAQNFGDEWESDPLDVLEDSQSQEWSQPQVPEFYEIDESGGLASPFEEVPATDYPPASPSFEEELPPAYTDYPAEPSGVIGDMGPDYSKEAEFHRVYKSYNEQPTSSEAWETVVGPRASESYQVQNGDTLSGISSTFFGDFSYWPKLWSLNNPQILNPHEISPGMNIKFYPGTMDDAPTLAVGGDAGVGETQVPATLARTAPIPKGRSFTPVLNRIPPSLPSYQVGDVAKTEVIMDLQATSFPQAVEHLEFFISDSKVEGVGQVLGTEMNMQTAGDYQYIYVDIGNSSEKNFVVHRNMTEVSDPLVKGRKGQMVEIQGEIEIVERVSDKKNVYRAIVNKAIAPIVVGGVLVPGRLPMIDPSPGPAVDGVGAKIMGGKFDSGRTLFGSNTLVFLDAGANQGLQVGQTLRVYADETVRNKNSEAVINDRVIGEAKIVRTAPNFATAYIVRATDNILLGDYIGTSRAQARSSMAPTTTNEFSDNWDDEFDSMESEAPADSGFDDSDLDF